MRAIILAIFTCISMFLPMCSFAVKVSFPQQVAPSSPEDIIITGGRPLVLSGNSALVYGSMSLHPGGEIILVSGQSAVTINTVSSLGGTIKVAKNATLVLHTSNLVGEINVAVQGSLYIFQGGQRIAAIMSKDGKVIKKTISP